MTDKAEEYRLSRQKHWARIAQEMTAGRFKGRYYHRRLAQVYRHVREAGGLVADMDGSDGFMDSGNIVCGNPKCFKAVLQATRHLPAAAASTN